MLSLWEERRISLSPSVSDLSATVSILLYHVIRNSDSRIGAFLQTRKLQLPDHVFVCKSIDEALILTQGNPKIESVFVIGGGQIYSQAISLPECQKLYLTVVEDSTACDTFFPEIPSFFTKTVNLIGRPYGLERVRSDRRKGSCLSFYRIRTGNPVLSPSLSN